MISEVRKTFWIPSLYSAVKTCIRKCVHCRRFNNRPVALNQSPYRDFRLEPSTIPFRSLFLDYCGHFHVKLRGKYKGLSFDFFSFVEALPFVFAQI
mgnify:CR=1 FL=1